MIINLPPPRRFVIDMGVEQNEFGEEYSVCVLEEVTGTQDEIYIEGKESPWLGVSIEEIEDAARAGAYGKESVLILRKALEIKFGGNVD